MHVKPCGPEVDREIGLFTLTTKGQQVAGKYVVMRQKVGTAWKLCHGYLEHRQVDVRPHSDQPARASEVSDASRTSSSWASLSRDCASLFR